MRRLCHQSNTARLGAVPLHRALPVLLATLLIAGGVRGDDVPPLPEPAPDLEPLVAWDSPLGALEYRTGRGLRVGDTGLNIGGFTTVEFDREEGQDAVLDLDGLNFLVLLQPIDLLSGFAEIEIGNLFHWETDGDGPDSDPDATIERLYGDLHLDDVANLRFGKFQTPVGRWNLVPAEPFVWTAVDPIVAELAFDEHQTGAAAYGSLYPGSDTVSYWIYGQFLNPLDPSEDPEPADYSVGGRLELDHGSGNWSLGSSFLATEIQDRWSYLGGLDAVWRIGPVALTTEFTYADGDIEERNLWDVYVQGVYEVLSNFYLVGRFERIDPTAPGQDSSLLDVGVAWNPLPFVRFKADYRFADEETEDVTRGLFVSLSLVF